MATSRNASGVPTLAPSATDDVVVAGIPTEVTARAGRRGERASSWRAPMAFLLFPLLLYSMWVIGPLFYTFWMSLTDADGLSRASFIGLDNYRRLVNDDVFRTAFWNNVRWLGAFLIVPPVCGLGLAMLLNNELPGVRWIKAGFFSPMVLSAVVIGAVWTWMYFPQAGLINSTLEVLGYSGKRIAWIGDPDLATWAIIGAALWRQVGYVMILYLAGLKNVDTTLVDAAKTDGAGPFRVFRDIILPALSPVTVIVVVISIIDALRAFDLIQVMTAGGPANQSHVLATWMYRQAFFNYNMGYGASIAVVLMLISMGFIFVYLYRMVKQEQEADA